jgi:hypothetical protein
MTWPEIWIGFCVNVVAGVFIFMVGLLWPKIPKSYRMWRLRRFWGRGVLGDDFAIVYGSLLDSRLLDSSPPPFRFVKVFHDSRTIEIAGPTGRIVGDCEIRAISYLTSSLSRFRRKPLPVAADADAIAHLGRTLVALGSPASNEIADLALREEANTFLRFGQDGDGAYIEHLPTGQKLRGFRSPIRRDYGIVLKIPNTRFPGHHFFVCAGLGESGTSGAAWYLATKWNTLSQEPGFGLIVEVEVGSDESARQIYPTVASSDGEPAESKATLS